MPIHPACDPATLVPLPAQPAGVPWPTSVWPTAAHPNADAIDALLDVAFAGDRAFDRFGESLAVVIVQGGTIVAERYGPDTTVDTKLISWSMAKSMVQAAVGILVGRGELDIRARAPVPEWADTTDPRHAITLDHLLRMASGLEFAEDYVDESKSHCIEMLFGDGQHDMAAYAASLPAAASPDSQFNYSSGTSNIVARIVGDRIAAGNPDTSGAEDAPDRHEATRDWLRANIFEPLGMRSASPKFDTAGTFVGSSFVWATARDFARFGLLYLRDGVWEGERLLPEGWVDYARARRGSDEEGCGYGAHWWVWDDPPGTFAAQGYETQRIIVVPGADAVVVRLGKTPIEVAPNVDDWLRELIGALAS